LKRRGFLTAALLAAPAAAVGVSTLKLDGIKVEDERIAPKYFKGEDHLCRYEESNDVQDFHINIDYASKVIDIVALHESKPQLTVLALHRFLSDLSDRVACGDGDMIDITSDTISERSTDSMITMVHGWSTSSRAKEHLIGGLAENGEYYSSVVVIGEIDYDLTKDITILQDGITYPYSKSGHARVPVKKGERNRTTISYKAYKNVHHVYNEETRELDTIYGRWVSEEWTVDPVWGRAIVPIFSKGT
jgi:hypothetical protein